MKIGRLFAALKKDLPGLALHYVCIEGSCLLFWLGWLSMMDDIKKAVTQMFCVKMALIASLSCSMLGAAVVLHIKWYAFYELLALQKPNHIQQWTSLFLYQEHVLSIVLYYGLLNSQMTLLFSLKD